MDKLNEVSGGRFYDPDRTKEAFAKSGFEISDPQFQQMTELAERDLKSENFDEFVDRAKKLTQATQDEERPFIYLTRPKLIKAKTSKTPELLDSELTASEFLEGKIVVSDSMGEPNSIESMRAGKNPLHISDYIPGNILSEVSEETGLQAWTSACLKKSEYMSYVNQLKWQIVTILSINGVNEADIKKITELPTYNPERKAFVKQHGFRADALLAMILHHAATGEALPSKKRAMRLNEQDSKGNPLSIRFNGEKHCFNTTLPGSETDSGIGASLRLSSCT